MPTQYSSWLISSRTAVRNLETKRNVGQLDRSNSRDHIRMRRFRNECIPADRNKRQWLQQEVDTFGEKNFQSANHTTIKKTGNVRYWRTSKTTSFQLTKIRIITQLWESNQHHSVSSRWKKEFTSIFPSSKASRRTSTIDDTNKRKCMNELVYDSSRKWEFNCHWLRTR